MKRARSVPLPPITLDRRRPLAGQIAAGVRIAIQTGRLHPGDRLPASRRLAQALGISRQVIVCAYEELTASGHVIGRTGDGSYVDDSARRMHATFASASASASVSASATASAAEPALAHALAPAPARRTLADPDGHAIMLWPLP